MDLGDWYAPVMMLSATLMVCIIILLFVYYPGAGIIMLFIGFFTIAAFAASHQPQYIQPQPMPMYYAPPPPPPQRGVHFGRNGVTFGLGEEEETTPSGKFSYEG